MNFGAVQEMEFKLLNYYPNLTMTLDNMLIYVEEKIKILAKLNIKECFDCKEKFPAIFVIYI